MTDHSDRDPGAPAPKANTAPFISKQGLLRTAFVAGAEGLWTIDRIDVVAGRALEAAPRLAVVEGAAPRRNDVWLLQGVNSNARYTNRVETDALTSVQQGLGRPQALNAALIPIRKAQVWWSLSQDERRSIFEEQSHHIGIGLDYLPAVSRRLYHSRDLGEDFDFLTWFEYAPDHSAQFETLVERLRRTREWAFVDREVDIRLSRTGER